MSLAVLLLLASAPQTPVNLAYREEPGIRLTYRTTLTYTVKLPPSVQAALANPAETKHQAEFGSTTFYQHLQREGDDMVTDVRTWTEDPQATGWLAKAENQPQGPRNGGGLMKRDQRGRFSSVPKTTDYAPELPVPTFPFKAVKPGSVWTGVVPFEGKLQTVTQKFESWEERAGIRCPRIEITGLTFSGLPLSAPMVVWIDPTTGRTLRMEAIFKKEDKETSASISYVRILIKTEGKPQPRPILSGPIDRKKKGSSGGVVLPPVGTG